MTDLEKIQRLTYVNAALALGSPGAYSAKVTEWLARAGMPPELVGMLHPAMYAHEYVGFVVAWAEREGLLS